MHTLGHHLRLVESGSGQQGHKLLAAPAAQHIGRTEDVAAQGGKQLQGLVTHRVAVHVVHALEVVQVHHQQAGRRVPPLQQRPFLAQAVGERAAVG